MSEEQGLGFEYYKDRILLGLGAFLIAWLIYLTNGYLTLPTSFTYHDIAKMVHDNSPYTRDKALIDNKFERLSGESAKLDVIQNRLVDEIIALRLQVERLITTLAEQQKHLQRQLGTKEDKPDLNGNP